MVHQRLIENEILENVEWLESNSYCLGEMKYNNYVSDRKAKGKSRFFRAPENLLKKSIKSKNINNFSRTINRLWSVII